MKPQRGDVVLVLFPNSDLRTAKRRPALVIQASDLNTGLAQTLVAMITSNPPRAGHPSRVAVRLDSPEGRATALAGHPQRGEACAISAPTLAKCRAVGKFLAIGTTRGVYGSWHYETVG